MNVLTSKYSLIALFVALIIKIYLVANMLSVISFALGGMENMTQFPIDQPLRGQIPIIFYMLDSLIYLPSLAGFVFLLLIGFGKTEFKRVLNKDPIVQLIIFFGLWYLGLNFITVTWFGFLPMCCPRFFISSMKIFFDASALPDI